MSLSPYDPQNQRRSLTIGPPMSKPQSRMKSVWFALSEPCRRGSPTSDDGRLVDSRLEFASVNFALPRNLFVPRRVTKLMPTPPVCTFRSLPPVLTATSSKASKSKYIDEAPPEVVSVMATPSRFHIVSAKSDPLPTKLDCWPDSLPPTLTRSTITPGTVLSIAHGSFDCGVLRSSSCVNVVVVPIFLTSTTGVSAVTLTVSSIDFTAIPKVIVALTPVVTMTSRSILLKPVSVVDTL